METPSEHLERMYSEMKDRIHYLETCISESTNIKTSDWGSGTFKKRKNKAYYKNHNSRLIAWQEELTLLKEKIKSKPL